MVLPGDIIKAKIKSLSETRKILLTIEDDDLGVILSRDDQGDFYKPLDKYKMICEKTGKEINKKVANLKIENNN